jgi:protein-S-isoprenylcysteine O-methyltransferase Ste14
VQLLAGLFVGAGIILISLAFIEMRKHRTTIMPRQTANALFTQGIFKRTRNPIYLGDTFILLGFVLAWDAVLSLSLVPVFVWIIETRYIVPEEDSLRRKFRLEFARYLQQTRRWM